MKAIRRGVWVLVAGLLTGSLTGCSVDALIWGNDGARVISTAEALIAALSSGTSSDLICAGVEPDLGTPSDWAGLSAGEPERFVDEYWREQAALDPQWSINLEGLPEGAVPGTKFPGDVFMRETDDGLCVADVAWATLVSVG